MTVKISKTAADQYYSAPDNDAFTIPADPADWTIAFILGLDGVTTAAEPQYLVSTGAFQAVGSLNIAYQPTGQTEALRDKLVVYVDNLASPVLTTTNVNAAGSTYLFVIQRTGGTISARRCPILAAAPADGSAVVADGSGTLSLALNSPSGLFIGARADLNATRALDQSIGRVFYMNGTLTDLEVAQLAYGKEITGLGKTPLWYSRLDTADDFANRGSAAVTFSKSGTPTTSTTQPAFGYVAPAEGAPVITGTPTISAAPQVGQAVGYTPASVTGTSTRTQQWAIDGVDVSGATGATYTSVAGDLGKALTVRQIETNGSGSVNATSPAATIAAAPTYTVTVTAPTAERIFQRIGTAAPVALSGAYTGTAPASLEYQLYAEDGTTILKAWAVMAATISGGTWSASPNVPQGGMYRVAVRSKDSGGAVLASSAVAVNLFGVGDLIASIGSSSAEKWFDLYSGTGNTPAANVRMYNQAGWAKFGTDGCAINMANSFAQQAGVPIGMLDYGVGGDKLLSWIDTSYSSWTAFAGGIAAVGGKLAGVMSSVGSNDAATGNVVSRAQHLANLRTLVTNTRTATGQSNLPFLISGYNRRTNAVAVQSDYVRMAENDVGDDPNVYHVQTLDFELSSDGIHLSTQPAGFPASGVRNSYVFGGALYGGAYRRGPKVTSLVYSGSTVTATLAHRTGTDFVPTSGITGFTVSDPSGILTVTAARVDATHIALTCHRTLTAPVTVKYLSGADPAVGTPVYNNSTPALPMQVETDLAATEASPTMRTVSVTLNTDAVTKAANLTGIQVAFSTGTGPHDAGARLFGSSSETTDANGLMTFSFDSSAISAGQEGLLSVLMPDKRHYLGLVAVT